MSREFDDLGPVACVSEIMQELQRTNPELLQMATQWANDLDDPDNVMTAFGMFYRLLSAAAQAPRGSSELSPLPRVSHAARTMLVQRIEVEGNDRFSSSAIDEMDQSNPELLVMAHNFAEDRTDYAQVMRGFALLYAALQTQLGMDRLSAH